MTIQHYDNLVLGTLRFPGRAGELQAIDDRAGLLSELGRNYRLYHGFLADEVRRVGRPAPDHYENFLDYTAAWSHAHRLVHAEILLRVARELAMGTPAGAAQPLLVPLVDADDQLVDVESA